MRGVSASTVGLWWTNGTDTAGVTIVAVDRAGNASAPGNARTVDINWGLDCPV